MVLCQLSGLGPKSRAPDAFYLIYVTHSGVINSFDVK